MPVSFPENEQNEKEQRLWALGYRERKGGRKVKKVMSKVRRSWAPRTVYQERSCLLNKLGS